MSCTVTQNVHAEFVFCAVKGFGILMDGMHTHAHIPAQVSVKNSFSVEGEE